MDTKDVGVDIKVIVREHGDKAAIAEIQGEIDVYTSPKLKEALTKLIEQQKYNIIIDLEKVRYIDSTGLGVLIGTLKKVREHNGTICIICTNPQIKKIFNITGLVKIFGIYKNEEEALKNLV